MIAWTWYSSHSSYLNSRKNCILQCEWKFLYVRACVCVFETDTEFLPVICWLSKNHKPKQWSAANEAAKDLKIDGMNKNHQHQFAKKRSPNTNRHKRENQKKKVKKVGRKLRMCNRKREELQEKNQYKYWNREQQKTKSFKSKQKRISNYTESTKERLQTQKRKKCVFFVEKKNLLLNSYCFNRFGLFFCLMFWNAENGKEWTELKM